MRSLHHPRFRLPTRRRCWGVSSAACQSNGGFIMGSRLLSRSLGGMPGRVRIQCSAVVGFCALDASSAGRDARAHAGLRSREALLHREAVFREEQSEPLLPVIA